MKPHLIPLMTSALCVGILHSPCAADTSEPVKTPARSPYAQWSNGPSSDPSYFPIAVWLQNPSNAARYKAAGINLYVGLWRGPTPQQLSELEKSGMSVICAQNRAGLEHRDNPTIVGWMHDDEPDNAQSLGQGKGYGPPILPEKILRDYEAMRAADPSRPVLLNLGQGVAWDNWIGRGVRRNHPEDYPEYVKGCDIASFDIYPVVHDSAEVAGKLEFVPRGVERLVRWTEGKKPVWSCIECTHISNPNAKASPAQVRAEVWMALIHGARGLIYFVHQFQPGFKEAALLDDPELLAAVTGINRQIHELAPVLNSADVDGGVVVQVEPGSRQELPNVARSIHGQPVASLYKRHNGAVYLFTVNMRNVPVRTVIELDGLAGETTAIVLGEDRQVAVKDGHFADSFGPYDVNLYTIRAP